MNRQRMQIKITKEEIESRISQIASQLNEKYKEEELYLIGTLKGSVFFLCELAKMLTMPVILDFVQISSYGDGKVSSGKVDKKLDISCDLEKQNVLIVEDIIDTGRTIQYLKKYIGEKNPKRLEICTLLDKPARREIQNIVADYTGFVIEGDEFVVGYGLDYAQKYRNLPYIATI